MKKYNSRANWELARGNIDQIKTYCSKGEILLESNMTDNRHSILDCSSMLDFETKQPRLLIAHLNNIRQIMNDFYWRANPFFIKKTISVHWYHGSTGRGKTWCALDQMSEFHAQGLKVCELTLSRTELWFNGVEADTHAVLLDDFRASVIQYHKLLRLLDARPTRVEIKGGFTIWNPDVVFITSCYKPELCYSGIANHDGEGINQLLRRLNEVRDFNENPYHKVIELELSSVPE
jgi:hypothetical protein